MPSPDLIRTFVGFSTPCPPDLARLLKELAQLGFPVKASAPRSLHCTLRFLGDTSRETADRLGPAITQALADVRTFSAAMTGIGAFPGPQRPTVVWTGLVAPELTDLYQRVEDVAVSFGNVRENKPFRPHVTLARIKLRPPPRLAELMQQHADQQWGAFDITAVELFKSTRTSVGSRYEILASAPLRR